MSYIIASDRIYEVQAKKRRRIKTAAERALFLKTGLLPIGYTYKRVTAKGLNRTQLEAEIKRLGVAK